MNRTDNSGWLLNLLGTLVGVWLLAAPVTAQELSASDRRPNIILIVADDLGYADVGYHGCKDISTPNIDALARGGVRCTSGYVSAPVCSPTRAGLMTGRYQQRFGYEFNPGPPAQVSPNYGVPLQQSTLPEQLKKAGYVTGMIGKWHLGLKAECLPTRRGFDEFFGFPHGSHAYWNTKPDERNPIMRGTETVDEKEYLTRAFGREATAFIDRHHDQPLFLYLAFNAVHAPMQAPEDDLARFPNIADPKRRTYAAMLASMDDAIGQVMAKVRERKLESRTLVFFISDNGGPPTVNASRNDPLRGSKGNVYEGGIRVPFIVQWKGRLPEGVAYDQPVISLDILATAAAAGGQPVADLKLDGVNLLPYLSGQEKKPPHERLFWRIGDQMAVREGNMKLVKPRGESWQLYDLAKDISETTDLAKQRPETADSLRKAWTAWNSELADPLWLPKPRARKGAKAKTPAPKRVRD